MNENFCSRPSLLLKSVGVFVLDPELFSPAGSNTACWEIRQFDEKNLKLKGI